MTRDELVRDLAQIERVIRHRVTLVRVIVVEDGHELYRLSCSSFQAPPGWRPPDEGNRS